MRKDVCQNATETRVPPKPRRRGGEPEDGMKGERKMVKTETGLFVKVGVMSRIERENMEILLVDIKKYYW